MNTIQFNSSIDCLVRPILPMDCDENQQSVKIQKAFRGFLARRGLLPCSNFPIYSEECRLLNESTPRALEGKTAVYLPERAPNLVIKDTGASNAKKRHFQNQSMRELVNKGKLTSLVIPRSRIYKNYLIEDRLSISTDPGYNATLYLNNPELFNKVAEQMTTLFKIGYIDYLVEKAKDSERIKRIRYDNIPFLVQEKHDITSISIGLIDLERSSTNEKVKSLRHKLFILSNIFPLHWKLIQEQAQKCDMILGSNEIAQIENSILHAKFYYEEQARQYLIHQSPPKAYITYQDLSERRFGDALMTYLHAKWISFVSGAPLAYRPFIFSDRLNLSDLEVHFDEVTKFCGPEIKFRKQNYILSSLSDHPNLYCVHYFPECRWELQHGVRHNGKPWVDYFNVDWKNPEFRSQIQYLISPKDIQIHHELPTNKLCLALHYRDGGGFDKDIPSLNLPLKFPPVDFYVDGIKNISSAFLNCPIYCFLFTDAADPAKTVEYLKGRLPEGIDIDIEWRKQNNFHNLNVIEDFFSFFQFDAFIYPQSNFSMIPALINQFAATFTLTSAVQTIGRVEVENTELTIDDERRRECLNRMGLLEL
ncbi:MAG: hypothetical protein FJZ57_04305 [Chlamydiae bacterium]|nr:hypothetical protein [Chlamydiota bacterium]